MHKIPLLLRHFVVAIASALGLSACISPANQHIPAEPRKIGAADIAQPSSTAASAPTFNLAQWPRVEWWTGYGDTQLNRCIELALEHSPNMEVAKARLQQAIASTHSVEAADGPNVTIGTDATPQLYSKTGLIPPPYAGTFRTSGDLMANLSYQFDFWGKNRHLVDAALGRQAAARAEANDAASALGIAVAKTYYQWQSSAAHIAQLDKALLATKRLHSIYQRRVQAGIDLSTAMHNAEVDVATLEQQISNLQTQQSQIFYQLRALMGNPSQATILTRVSMAEVISRLQNGLPSQLPLDLLSHRADIQAARAYVESGLNMTAAAKTDFYPNINITAFLGLSSLGLSNLLSSASKTYGATPAIHLPIFDKGRLQAAYARSQADVDLAIAQYNQALIRAVSEVNDAIARAQGLEQEEAVLHYQQQAQEKEWHNAKQRQAQGLIDGREVLRLEQLLLQTQDKFISLQSRILDAQLDLTKALGGGYHYNEVASNPSPDVSQLSSAPVEPQSTAALTPLNTPQSSAPTH